MKNVLTHKKILKEAEYFSITESNHHDPGLYGVNDGKTIGTYFEHKFQDLQDSNRNKLLVIPLTVRIDLH